jgi:hypothetical protein
MFVLDVMQRMRNNNIVAKGYEYNKICLQSFHFNSNKNPLKVIYIKTISKP